MGVYSSAPHQEQLHYCTASHKLPRRPVWQVNSVRNIIFAEFTLQPCFDDIQRVQRNS